MRGATRILARPAAPSGDRPPRRYARPPGVAFRRRAQLSHEHYRLLPALRRPQWQHSLDGCAELPERRCRFLDFAGRRAALLRRKTAPGLHEGQGILEEHRKRRHRAGDSDVVSVSVRCVVAPLLSPPLEDRRIHQAQAGDIQIELVSQRDTRPSFWHDVVPAGQTGLHHMALYCDDYDASLDAYLGAGMAVAFSGLMMGARVCWVDATRTLGFMIELIEANPVADAVFANFREAARDWDGSDPLRPVG